MKAYVIKNGIDTPDILNVYSGSIITEKQIEKLKDFVLDIDNEIEEKKLCINCKWYNASGFDNSKGDCRRYAPNKDVQFKDVRISDFCGEWEENKEDK
jgi:hypothetical protein